MLKAIIASLLMVGAASAQAETRCGWIENPTPANVWLVDAAGVWDISIQMQYEAEGFENMDPIWEGESQTINVNKSRFCGCLTGEFSRPKGKVVRIDKSQSQALRTCRNDKNLPAPVYPN